MPPHKSIKILILAHDVSDSSVARRAVMLQTGGADIRIAGFRRAAKPVERIAGCDVTDLGRTYNGAFVHRILSVIRQIFLITRHRELFADTDIVIARNLEMLALGVRGRALCPKPPVLIYESLDIHRLMLRKDIVGITLRTLEGWLARRAAAVMTSAPAFITGYFEPLSHIKRPIWLVENKLLDIGGALNGKTDELPIRSGPPWVIGWFGVIRCRKSLDILTQIVKQNPGLVEVVIRGRPALDQFDDFHKSIAGIPGLHFLGPYKNPDDLAGIYRQIHFTWAIDMYEEGLNSAWLLPNRLYEGGYYNAVPLADGNVDTGHYIVKRGIGVTLGEPLADALAAFLKQLMLTEFRKLVKAMQDLPRTTWAYSKKDCEELIDRMRVFLPEQSA